MSRTRIGRHDMAITPLVLGDGDSLVVARLGELHATGRQNAVLLFGGSSQLHNAGTIRSDEASAITGHLSGPADVAVRNAGAIIGGSFGISLVSDADGTGTVAIHNAGSITARGYAAVDFALLHVDQTRFVNDGALNVTPPGSTSAPLAFAGSDGRDAMLNRGTVHGTVALGGGDDVFRDTAASHGELSIILGEDGDDRISGGSGADLIVGGAGRDVMSGGAGADTFSYNAVSESGPDGNHADRIHGFAAIEGDVIDLSRIDADASRPGDQAFTQIGTATFSGTSGELRCDLLTGGGLIVSADVNGDGLPDFMLVVCGDVHAPEDLALIL